MNGIRPIRCVLAVMCFSLAAAHAAPPLSGAIFTTTENGDVVNGNTKYTDICEVYLDGGPGPNAPATAAGLPDGDYYYQVTDPSGKTLLSNDPVQNRCFTVSGGIITAQCATGTHNTGIDIDQGATTIQLCPYELTPNNGGVYKVWVTPVGDGTLNGGGFVGDPTQVDNPCGNGCFHGFIPARSKTDNWKIGDEPTHCLTVHKKVHDGHIWAPVKGWEITITDPQGVTNTVFTDANGVVEECPVGDTGTYQVMEAQISPPPDERLCTVRSTRVDGDYIEPPTDTVLVSFRGRKAQTVVVSFRNECW